MLVRQFQTIQNVLNSKKDSLDKEIEVVSLMTGINEDELLKLPLHKIKDLFSKYSSSNVKVSTSINKYLFIKQKLFLVDYLGSDEIYISNRFLLTLYVMKCNYGESSNRIKLLET